MGPARPSDGLVAKPAVLDRAFGDVLRAGAGGLGLLYAFFAVAHWLVLKPPAGPVMAALAAASAGALLALYAVLGRWKLPDRCAHTAGTAVGLVVLLNVTTHMALVPDSSTANLQLLLIGAGCCLLSAPHLAVFWVASWIAWWLLARSVPGAPNLDYQLATATVVSAIVQQGRIRGILRTEAALFRAELAEESLRAANEELEERVRLRTADLARALAALRESEQRFRLLAENAQDVVFRYRVDPEPAYEYISPYVGRVLGYSPDEFYADPVLFQQIVLPEDRELIPAAHHQSGGRPLVVRCRRKDGAVVWIEQRFSRIYDDTGTLVRVEGIARDVTEQRLLEEQLAQAQKMDAIGRLAGGIAHDFNNLLSVVGGYSELMLDSRRLPPALVDAVEQIRTAGRRAAELTRKLMAFGRLQFLRPTVLDVNQLLEQLQPDLRKELPGGLELNLRLDAETRPVRFDREELERVVKDLVGNARDAIRGPGMITLATRSLEVTDSGLSGDTWLESGRYVLLTVSDTGAGIPREILSRVIEPFFTTKSVEVGSGLGLSTVYGVIKQSGGHLRVASEPGRGTTVEIFLPAVPAAERSEGSLQPPPGGSETVLVVESEPMLLSLASTVLTDRGYRVLTARTPEEALTRCEAEPGEIHLMVVPVMLPGSSGRELAEQVLRRRPGTAVLYVSDHLDESASRQGVLLPEVPFLAKPYSPRALARKVRAILDHSRTREPAARA
jgi:PAS domain S-box-containing protein